MTKSATIPDWLTTMRAISGITETPGSGNNPKIMAMADEIARVFPYMSDYCALYRADETPWCGLTVAYCMAMAGIAPPYQPPPADETEDFLWAFSWKDDPGYQPISAPRPGCVVVMERSGGGHVTLYESTDGSYYKCRGGNQSDAINVSSYPKSSVVALMWPRDVPLPPAPPAERSELSKGDVGPGVAEVQTILGIVPADGDFGSITEGGVKGFQRATGLGADGIVGPDTWDELDDLDARKTAGFEWLSPELIADICDMVERSEIAAYSWDGRSKMPLGYTQGVALCFALAQTWLAAGDPAAVRMARKNTGNEDKDVLAWYDEDFDALGMDNSKDGIDTLRHLFALMLGLGPRESSGRYCEGRDMSASNVQSDTAEAGMFQTSWNIRSCDSAIAPLLAEFWDNPNGFLMTFQNGVKPDANDLDNFGSGDGARYQFLSKYCPVFHAFVTALGMRSLRQHWGPINRREVELKDQANEMLLQVQELVGEAPSPPEPPIDVLPTITITIDPPGSARVVIVGGAANVV